MKIIPCIGVPFLGEQFYDMFYPTQSRNITKISYGPIEYLVNCDILTEQFLGMPCLMLVQLVFVIIIWKWIKASR